MTPRWKDPNFDPWAPIDATRKGAKQQVATPVVQTGVAEQFGENPESVARQQRLAEPAAQAPQTQAQAPVTAQPPTAPAQEVNNIISLQKMMEIVGIYIALKGKCEAAGLAYPELYTLGANLEAKKLEVLTPVVGSMNSMEAVAKLYTPPQTPTQAPATPAPAPAQTAPATQAPVTYSLPRP